jgi:hypothetical protein
MLGLRCACFGQLLVELQVFRRVKQFRGDSSFSTWLFAVALNVYRSASRRRSMPSVPLDAIDELMLGLLGGVKNVTTTIYGVTSRWRLAIGSRRS